MQTLVPFEYLTNGWSESFPFKPRRSGSACGVSGSAFLQETDDELMKYFFFKIWISLHGRHQLQCPGQYSPLEAFYEDKKAVLPPTGNGLVTACPTWSVTAINRCMHPEMKVRGAPEPRPPIDGFSPQKFSNTLVSADHAPGRLHVPVHPVLRGADNGAVEVCVAAETPPHLLPAARRGGLLQGWAASAFAARFLTSWCMSAGNFQRLLPLVYCCCCLANVSIPGIGVSVPELRPFFYVNIADISALETEMSYVACECNFSLQQRRNEVQILRGILRDKVDFKSRSTQLLRE